MSQVPVSALDSNGDGDFPGITGILFDPAIGGVVNGVTQTIFAESYGNGVYESTNGGASWAKLSGGPTTVTNAAVSSTGVYYATDGTNLWIFANGKWTEPSVTMNGMGIQAIAVNPSNPNEIVLVSPAGYLDVSYNAGATWSGVDWDSNAVNSTDIPWLTAANEASSGDFLDIGGVVFNPLVPNQIIASAGTGVWNASVPTSNLQWNTPVTWNDQSLGIEQLVANEIIVPPGGNPVVASWDRPFFYISNLNAYPSTYGPVDSVNINAGWSVDYASSDPSFIAGLIDMERQSTRPMAARPGRLCQLSHHSRAMPMEERSPPARRKTSSWRQAMAFNLIIPSTAARLGILSLFRVLPAGAVLKVLIISMSAPSPPTGCSPIRSICFIRARASSKPPMVAQAGHKSIAAISRHSIGTIMN